MSDSDNTATAEQFKQELQAQIDKIDEAIAALPDGEIGNLQELDRNVSDLCNRLENAPRETAQESEPLMSRMISRLEELEQKLRAHQDDLNLGSEDTPGQQQDPAQGEDDTAGGNNDSS